MVTTRAATVIRSPHGSAVVVGTDARGSVVVNGVVVAERVRYRCDDKGFRWALFPGVAYWVPAPVTYGSQYPEGCGPLDASREAGQEGLEGTSSELRESRRYTHPSWHGVRHGELTGTLGKEGWQEGTDVMTCVRWGPGTVWHR